MRTKRVGFELRDEDVLTVLVTIDAKLGISGCGGLSNRVDAVCRGAAECVADSVDDC